MHYNISNPHFDEFKVFLNGDIRDDAIEANDDNGWVIVETQIQVGWGTTKPWPKKLYGKVHIVRYTGYDDEEEETESDNVCKEPSYA